MQKPLPQVTGVPCTLRCSVTRSLEPGGDTDSCCYGLLAHSCAIWPELGSRIGNSDRMEPRRWC